MSWFDDLGNWFKKGDNLKGLGSAAVGLGSLYSNYEQSRYSKELLDLQKADYNRGIQREDKMDDYLNRGFEMSDLNKKKKKQTVPGLVALG